MVVVVAKFKVGKIVHTDLGCNVHTKKLMQIYYFVFDEKWFELYSFFHLCICLIIGNLPIILSYPFAAKHALN